MHTSASDDLRVKKTKKLIREAFAKLLCEKCFRKLTVSELVKEAGIGRKTFYLHYQSMEDLAISLQDEMLDEIFETLRPYRLPADLEEIIRRFYGVTERYGVFGDRLLTIGDRERLDARIADTVKTFSWIEEGKTGEYQRQVMMLFVFEGIWKIYWRWKKDGKLFTVDEMIRGTALLIGKGVKADYDCTGKNGKHIKSDAV